MSVAQGSPGPFSGRKWNAWSVVGVRWNMDVEGLYTAAGPISPELDEELAVLEPAVLGRARREDVRPDDPDLLDDPPDVQVLVDAALKESSLMDAAHEDIWLTEAALEGGYVLADGIV